MKLLVKDRGTGKTTGLIYTSEATGYPIVTSSKIQAHYIKDNAEKMGCLIPEPLTVEEVRSSHVLRGRDNKILFDNVETILSAALNAYLDANIICATMTSTEKVKNNHENSAVDTEEQENKDK